MCGVDDLVVCLSDFNKHVGGHSDGFIGVHGEYGVGQRILEGGMLLSVCLVKVLCVNYMV